MNLTSPLFTWFVRATLVVVLVWVVVRWSAAARPTVVGVLRRVASLVVVMVLAVLNVLVPINAEYGWYSSWSDVWSDISGDTAVVPAGETRGLDPGRSTREHVGRSPLSVLPTSERGRVPLQLTNTTVGGYQTFQVPGPKSHYTGQVTVWFPPEYRRDTTATFPVLEVFHGYLPAPLATFRVFHMDQVLHDLSTGGKIRQPILVIPHWAPGRLDTECVDGGLPGTPAMETWLTQDVPAWIYENFRVSSSRESWATMGYSAGGWCSLMATMLHPTTYSAAISLGGYARPDFDPPYVPFGDDTAAWRRYDLVRLAERKPPAVAVWSLTSTPDKLSAPSTTALIQKARPPLSVTPTVLTTGAHRAEVWEPYIEPSLAWLGHASPGFSPAR